MRWILIGIMCVSLQVQGQSTKDFHRKWELGKAHYKDGNYDMALILFQNLTSENSQNPFVEYANYYTALCNFHLGKLKVARQYLLQLNNKYPLWDKRDDATYLLANIAFENREYLKSLNILKECSLPEKENMKLHYLSLTSVDTLASLLDSFPNDKQVATVYCYKRAAQGIFFDKDRQLIDSLMHTFDIRSDSLAARINGSMLTMKKDTFHVALLYPFMLKELKKYQPVRKNQFLIDHYWGLQTAADSLMRDSTVALRLHLYDNVNDTNRVKAILALSEMKKMDAVIGSVYRRNMPYVSKFCDQNQIICFNPLSNYSSTIHDSGFVYMHNPAYESIGKSAARFVIDSFPDRKIMVLCFQDNKDTTIANAFIKTLADSNIKMAKKLFIKPGTDVLYALSKVKNEEVDLIFAPSENTSIATNITSWMVIREIEFPIIGNASWLESREYNIVNVNNTRAFYYNASYIDYAADTLYGFEKMYFDRYNVPPTATSYSGFELGMLMGNMFATYGKYFNQALWNMEPYHGWYYPLYDYSGAYYNTFVPIHELKDYKLIPANYRLTTNLSEEIPAREDTAKKPKKDKEKKKN